MHGMSASKTMATEGCVGKFTGYWVLTCKALQAHLIHVEFTNCEAKSYIMPLMYSIHTCRIISCSYDAL